MIYGCRHITNKISPLIWKIIFMVKTVIFDHFRSLFLKLVTRDVILSIFAAIGYSLHVPRRDGPAG